MPACPVCAADIKDDFGLVTCPSCGSQVLLEMDGVAGVVPVPSPAAGSPTPPQIESLSSDPQPLLADELSQVLVAEFDSPPIEKAPTSGASSDMSDIANFGNSEISQGREGMLRFNLHIGGIDTSDIRAEVREILTDARFLWDAEKLMSEIRDGELHIKEITAVKSALLVQRLRTVPVEIRWEQYAIHQV